MNSAWVSSVFATLVGVVVGGLLAYQLGKRLDANRRKQEAEDVTVSLYVEIADRAARCVNDYIEPWRRFEGKSRPSDPMPTSRVGKFRPMNPVVLPPLASKLALVRPEALIPTLRFYFRLDALRREIDSVTGDFDSDVNLMEQHEDRVRLVAKRFLQTLGPALTALEKLNIPKWDLIDREGVAEYEQLGRYGKPLREAIRDFSRRV